jgi:[acyl-carrier-protein] S-malonyltransferase
MSIAVIFPGQGSQKVGMGSDLATAGATALFSRADAVLGESLSRLMFEGPEGELTLTANAQPAILTASLAVAGSLPEGLLEGAVGCAGHSLGEFTALAWSGALDFSDAVRLVRNRGRYMQEAVPPGEGAMAAIIGMDDAAVSALCEASGEVWVANLNSPGQTVVSGRTLAVREVGEKAKEAGAKMVIPLAVSAPFHSPLMEPAALRLAEDLKRVAIRAPRVPVVANVTAAGTTDPEEIRDLLVRQVVSPVRWVESVQALAHMGATTFVELGPGAVLSGLVKRIIPGVVTASAGDAASVAALPEKLGSKEKVG